jgi:hypothetical protein
MTPEEAEWSMISVLLGQADVVLFDYEIMVREAEAVFADRPDPMAVARAMAERIACNPAALLDWPAFLEMNK